MWSAAPPPPQAASPLQRPHQHQCRPPRGSSCLRASARARRCTAWSALPWWMQMASSSRDARTGARNHAALPLLHPVTAPPRRRWLAPASATLRAATRSGTAPTTSVADGASSPVTSRAIARTAAPAAPGPVLRPPRPCVRHRSPSAAAIRRPRSLPAREIPRGGGGGRRGGGWSGLDLARDGRRRHGGGEVAAWRSGAKPRRGRAGIGENG